MRKITTPMIIGCLCCFFVSGLSLAENKSEKFKFKVQSAEEIQGLKQQTENDIKEEKKAEAPVSLSLTGTATAELEAYVNCPQGGAFERGVYRADESTWTRPNTSAELLSWEDAGTTCARGSERNWNVDELRNEEGTKYGYRLNVACRGKGNFGGSGCMGQKIKINYKQ